MTQGKAKSNRFAKKFNFFHKSLDIYSQMLYNLTIS